MELEGKTLLSTMSSSLSPPHHQPEDPTFTFGTQRQFWADWTYLRAEPQNGWAFKPANQFN